jgi:predicted nucleotidyltransferase
MTRKVYSIDEIKDCVVPVAKEFGVTKAYLFGSYARGEAKPDSDVDICIEKGKIRSLFQLGGFYADLEENLDKEIDVVTLDGLKDNDFKHNIEKEMVEIYG